jgi:hypothetical protein
MRLDSFDCVCCVHSGDRGWKYCACALWRCSCCVWRAHDCTNTHGVYPRVDAYTTRAKGCKEASRDDLSVVRDWRHKEEGRYENASYRPHTETSNGEGHLEEGVLYQPLPEAAASKSEAGVDSNSVVPLCEPGSRSSDRSCAHDAMRNRNGDTGGSCGCDVWVHDGKIAMRRGHHYWLGAVEVTAGAVGAALSGFAFAACVVGGGEVDVAIHCVLGPGVAFDASVAVIGAGIKEIF